MASVSLWFPKSPVPLKKEGRVGLHVDLQYPSITTRPKRQLSRMNQLGFILSKLKREGRARDQEIARGKSTPSLQNVGGLQACTFDALIALVV